MLVGLNLTICHAKPYSLNAAPTSLSTMVASLPRVLDHYVTPRVLGWAWFIYSSMHYPREEYCSTWLWIEHIGSYGGARRFQIGEDVK